MSLDIENPEQFELAVVAKLQEMRKLLDQIEHSIVERCAKRLTKVTEEDLENIKPIS